MAWTSLPTTEGTYSLNGNILANSVGTSLDDMLDEANTINSALSTAITELKTQLHTDVSGLTTNFSPSLDTTTVFSSPTTPTAPTLDAAPTAPTVGTTLLDEAAYSGAFALARDALLEEEQRALWDAAAGAAANGIGLPSSVSQGMILQSEQARRQGTSKVALEQATLKAGHLREDLKWQYTQQLDYYKEKSSVVLAAFAQQIALLQASLAKEAEKRQWKTAANQTELERAKIATESSLQLQQFAVKISQDAALAYAGALAEQFKAWLAAVHFQASASAPVDNATYAGP